MLNIYKKSNLLRDMIAHKYISTIISYLKMSKKRKSNGCLKLGSKSKFEVQILKTSSYRLFSGCLLDGEVHYMERKCAIYNFFPSHINQEKICFLTDKIIKTFLVCLQPEALIRFSFFYIFRQLIIVEIYLCAIISLNKFDFLYIYLTFKKLVCLKYRHCCVFIMWRSADLTYRGDNCKYLLFLG